MQIGGSIVVYGFEGYSISVGIIQRIGGLSRTAPDGNPLLLCNYTFMGNLIGIFFPVLTVKWHDLNPRRLTIQTPQIDVNAIRIRSWGIKGLDSTNFTKGMLGDPCIKGVGG